MYIRSKIVQQHFRHPKKKVFRLLRKLDVLPHYVNLFSFTKCKQSIELPNKQRMDLSFLPTPTKIFKNFLKSFSYLYFVFQENTLSMEL